MEPFIDPGLALGHVLPEVVTTHDARDVCLYALGVGAGADPDNTWELPFVYEGAPGGLRVLPTFAIMQAANALLEHIALKQTAPGLRYPLESVLHGEQRLELFAPIPLRGKLTHRSRIADLVDKGKNALVITAIETFDEAGTLIAKNDVTCFVKGGGGFGEHDAPRVRMPDIAPPTRKADVVVTERINDNQALLYRLCGDWNPLHVDPSFAMRAGLDRPILHGLCTLGIAGRHVLHTFADDDPSRIGAMRVRFAGSVYPGDTLCTEMWQEGDDVSFRSSILETGDVVLSQASCRLNARAAARDARVVEG